MRAKQFGRRRRCLWRMVTADRIATVMSEKTKYRRIIGDDLFEDVTPILSSTPKKHAEKHCICNKRFDDHDASMVECTKCKRWYHAICINADLEAAKADDAWVCGKCEGASSNSFPSEWKDSLPVERMPLNVSSISCGSGIATTKWVIPTPCERPPHDSLVAYNENSVQEEESLLTFNQSSCVCTTICLSMAECFKCKTWISTCSSNVVRECSSSRSICSIKAPAVNILDYATPSEINEKTTFIPKSQDDMQPILFSISDEREINDVSKQQRVNQLKSFETQNSLEDKHCSGSKVLSFRLPLVSSLSKEYAEAKREHTPVNNPDPAAWLHATYHDAMDTIKIATSEDTLDGSVNQISNTIMFTVCCEGTIQHPPFCTKKNRIQAEDRQSLSTSAPCNYAVEHPIAYEEYLARQLVSPSIATDSISVIKGRCSRFEAELISQVGLDRKVNKLRRKRKQVARRSFASSWFTTLPFIEWGTNVQILSDFYIFSKYGNRTRANK
ncbi:unnamed protein product [Allacma fusca]|uniref:PHD-type domain-containing protein n=1 Tax=Allacma fusca TaxID=39272 RepID=A0A8J2LI40_9HEXA|nr:unnamed protein product [Allacma fusca]